MPRFFFDLSDAGVMQIDEVGNDLACVDDARKEAITTLASIARDELPDGDHHVLPQPFGMHLAVKFTRPASPSKATG